MRMNSPNEVERKEQDAITKERIKSSVTCPKCSWQKEPGTDTCVFCAGERKEDGK